MYLINQDQSHPSLLALNLTKANPLFSLTSSKNNHLLKSLDQLSKNKYTSDGNQLCICVSVCVCMCVCVCVFVWLNIIMRPVMGKCASICWIFFLVNL